MTPVEEKVMEILRQQQPPGAARMTKIEGGILVTQKDGVTHEVVQDGDDITVTTTYPATKYEPEPIEMGYEDQLTLIDPDAPLREE